MIGAAANLAIVLSFEPQLAGQAPEPAAKAAASKTPWGAPNLEGVWHKDLETPLQRNA